MSEDNTSFIMDIDGSSFVILSKMNSDGTSDKEAKMELNKLADSLSFNEMLKMAFNSAGNSNQPLRIQIRTKNMGLVLSRAFLSLHLIRVEFRNGRGDGEEKTPRQMKA